MVGTLATIVPDGTDTEDAGRAAVARLASLAGVTTASRVTAEAAGVSAAGKLLAVLPELEAVLPLRGLRRGSTVSVVGSRALLLALLAEATAGGSWAAVVGMPDIGVLAAAELGAEVSRLAVVPEPGADLAPVVGALLDGVDIVVIGGVGVHGRTARQLSARARHRGAVLLTAGPWPGAEVELRCAPGRWHGIDNTDGTGHGYLREREVVVTGTGRGAAARPVRVPLLLPGAGGRVAHPLSTPGEPLLDVESASGNPAVEGSQKRSKAG